MEIDYSLVVKSCFPHIRMKATYGAKKINKTPTRVCRLLTKGRKKPNIVSPETTYSLKL